ncbi:MAG: PIN domain-containing protein [Bacteroidales bacterium]|nr:PIN domain-containing protein [Bacteroidales bacterium]
MAKKIQEKKIFVLDTSVILYNHSAIYSFEDNDLAFPIAVLEELDNFKKGNDTKNFEAREFIRIIDKLSENNSLQEWINLDEEKKLGKCKVIMHENGNAKLDARKIFMENKADHRILNAALMLTEEYPERKVILVTKDINLRLKAKSLNIPAEDFETGKIKDLDQLYTGICTLEGVSADIVDDIYKNGHCSYQALNIEKPYANQFFIIRNTKSSVLAFFNYNTDRIERVEKKICHKISPRNAEQVFALHAILNPDVKLVTLQGVAGTGKTLLALAGSLEQRGNFNQIYLARPIVPLSNKDIGFLPGDIKSKISPYMEPLWDNLKMIQNLYGSKDREFKSINAD